MKEKNILKRIMNMDGIGIVAVYLVVFVFLSIACPNFLKFSNIMVGIRQAVYTAIVGFAMTFVISMGGIDLSVGSTVGIAGMVLAAMIAICAARRPLVRLPAATRRSPTATFIKVFR